MKKTVLIVFLSLVIIILGTVLYLFIETSPKQIKDESIGTMYTFRDISFDLVSNDYIGNDTLNNAVIEKENDQESIKVWVNKSRDDNFVIIHREKDELFEEGLVLLKNPLKHLQLENELLRTEDMQERDIYKVDIDYYISRDKIAILTKNYKNDGSITYQFEMKVGADYYVLIAEQSETTNIALQNIMEFMRTANISQ